MGTRKRAYCSEGLSPACVPLRFLLSRRLLSMKKKAPDRFRRDPRVLCNPTKWFGVLHHPMKDHRLVGRGKAIWRAFWPRPPFATHRRRTGVRGFIVSQQALNLERQVARRYKEERQNW